MGGRHIYRMFERVGWVGFELEEGITPVFNHQRDALRFAVEGVASDGGTVQRGGGVEPTGASEFALFFGFLTHGSLRGDGDGGGRTALVLAQTESQHEVAHVFSIDGQPARKGAVGGTEPAVERGGEPVGIGFAEQVVERGLARRGAEGAGTVGRPTEGGALFLGEKLAVALDRGEGFAPGEQAHGD